MRRLACVVLTAALAACGREAPPDTGMEQPAAAEPATISLEDVAGTWTMRAMPEDRDTVLVTFRMTATADRTGWSFQFDDRPEPVPVRVVAVEGDSVLIEAGPYSSTLRPDVMVSTRGVARLRDGMLVGRTVARYTVEGPDSVLVVRTEGTRAP